MANKLKNNKKLDLPDWIWWIGVIESRLDVAEAGRYRVRIMGYHSGNTNTLPTKDLPFATVINSPTSASTSGVMETPNLLPGSTVVGFFADGEEGQMPVIIGSIAGKPSAPTDEMPGEDGFNDPGKNWPRGMDGSDIPEGFSGVGESDLSRLARNESAETHYSLLNKREERTTEVRTAKAPSVSAATGDGVLDDKEGKDYEGKTWDEPHARGHETPKYFNPLTDLKAGGTGQPPEPGTYTSQYPFNQVKETEAGHVFEVDSTSGNERISEYHPIGNYTEIQSDGTRVNKIKGSDYEIIAGDKDVLIRGSCNITIVGDAKVLVQGDKYEEVEGDYFLSILGDRVTKINGNDIKSVVSDVTETIKGNRTVRVALDDTQDIVGKQSETVAKQKTEVVSGNVVETFGASHNTTITKNRLQMTGGALQSVSGVKMAIATGKIMEIGSKGNMLITTEADMTETITGQQSTTAANTDINNTVDVTGDVNITGTSTADVDHDSAGISGKGHTHTDTAGTSAGTTSAPN